MGLFKTKKESTEVEPIFEIKPNIQITKLPETTNRQDIDIRYNVIENYASIHIFWDKESNELMYNVEEPQLDEKERKILAVLESGINELINISFINIKSTKAIVEYLEKNVRVLLSELRIAISRDSFLKLMYYIYRDFVGLNEIEPLLRDYYIEDIECNGVSTPIYIVHRKYGNIKTNVIYNDTRKLTSFVEKLAQKCGKYISYASPLLDGALPDNSRVNATFTQDISSRGPAFTIRKFTKVPWTPVRLMQFGTVSPEMLAYLWLLIENQANIMIIGGTGSGKTSFLNALAFFIPPASRIVSIEDSITGNSEIIYKEKDQIKKTTISELTKQVEKRITKLEDLEILTLDEDMKVKLGKPIKFIRHRTDKDIYKITTSTGRVVEVTKDHSLFTLTINGLTEVKPNELEENNSCIAVPRILPMEGKGVFSFNLLNHLKHFRKDFLFGEPVKTILTKYNYKYFKVSKSTHKWWRRKNILPITHFDKIEYKFSENELKNLFIKTKNITKLPVIFELDDD
ncbi:Flp pilus assembly complex ATPase component TadA, partial [Candidatus Woesearchaeota archaeon]|nr:Flp pilus assembly complex ATPase component TadA [Candidatus Woesearchaeota archaeon]